MKHDHSKPRVTFTSKIGIVAAAAGSAVGLGNIWRFPSQLASGGGAIWLFVYLICVALLGMPIMMSEFLIGRSAKANAVRSYSVLRPGGQWHWVGVMALISSYVIAGFYVAVCAWTVSYFWGSISGSLMHVQDFVAQFQSLQETPGRMVFLTALFCLLTFVFIISGVNKGIEKSAKYMMPLLFLLLIILAIRSITLDGAEAGLKFLFKPDTARVKKTIFIDAIGQAFFSLSLASSVMITYGSYFRKHINLTRTSVQVSIMDTMVALLAGLVIFPSAFALSSNSVDVTQKLIAGGPGLLFITVPELFQKLPFPNLWSTLFFFLLAVAALTTLIAIFEALTVFVQEEFRVNRKIGALITTLSVLFLGVFATYSPKFFGYLDGGVSLILLPLGGMLTAIFVGYVLDRKVVENEITNNGTLSYKGYVKFYFFVVRYLAPVAIFVMLVYGLWPSGN